MEDEEEGRWGGREDRGGKEGGIVSRVGGSEKVELRGTGLVGALPGRVLRADVVPVVPPSLASLHAPASPSSDPRLLGPEDSSESCDPTEAREARDRGRGAPMELDMRAVEREEWVRPPTVRRAELYTRRSRTCALSLLTSPLRSATRRSPVSTCRAFTND